jgi:HD-GYP domain-containing protein (c-di-GMP phosphodiesterase class II)
VLIAMTLRIALHDRKRFDGRTMGRFDQRLSNALLKLLSKSEDLEEVHSGQRTDLDFMEMTGLISGGGMAS